jgi:nicotinamide-nucleotide amidase
MTGPDDGARALAQQVADLLDGRRIATAESCTAGGIAQALATADGASDFLLGGVVAYHRDVKYDVLDVPRGPVVNHRSAGAMARGVARLLGADVAVAVTGAAGPSGLDGAEAGTVFVGFSIDGIDDTAEYHFDGDPESVTNRAVTAALAGLVERLDPAADQPVDPAAAESIRSTSSSAT